MALTRLFELERHFTFYGQYHNNVVNQAIHMVFVWPIVWTLFVCLWYTPALVDTPQPFKGGDLVVINWAFLLTILYVLFYVGMEVRNYKDLRGVGVLGAIIASFCYVTAGVVRRMEAIHVPGLAAPVPMWQLALCLHYWCWVVQFVGHGMFEGRSPALLDNVIQAVFFAPFFVLLKALLVLGYNPEFSSRIQVKVDQAIAKWKAKEEGEKASRGQTKVARPPKSQKAS